MFDSDRLILRLLLVLLFSKDYFFDFSNDKMGTPSISQMTTCFKRVLFLISQAKTRFKISCFEFFKATLFWLFQNSTIFKRVLFSISQTNNLLKRILFSVFSKTTLFKIVVINRVLLLLKRVTPQKNTFDPWVEAKNV